MGVQAANCRICQFLQANDPEQQLVMRMTRADEEKNRMIVCVYRSNRCIALVKIMNKPPPSKGLHVSIPIY